MKTLKTILKWLFGTMFLLGGFAGLFDSFIIGSISMLLGIFILPPTFKVIEQKTNSTFPSTIKWVVVIAGMTLMGFTISREESEKDKEVDLIVEEASNMIDEGNLDSAFVLIQDAKGKYSSPDNNKAVDLEREIEKSKSVDFAKEILAKMTDEEFSKLENGELTKSYLTQKTLNQDLIALLQVQSPERQKIIKEIRAKEEQERIATELAEEERRETELKRKRKELVESQFSSWDGSHLELSSLIKKNCREPDSYEHIETRFRDDGSYITVITKYRARNGFGGMSIGTVIAKVDFEGSVIEIVSQSQN